LTSSPLWIRHTLAAQCLAIFCTSGPDDLISRTLPDRTPPTPHSSTTILIYPHILSNTPLAFLGVTSQSVRPKHNSVPSHAVYAECMRPTSKSVFTPIATTLQSRLRRGLLHSLKRRVWGSLQARIPVTSSNFTHNLTADKLCNEPAQHAVIFTSTIIPLN